MTHRVAYVTVSLIAACSLLPVWMIGQPGQLAITRVDQMPNIPQPLNIRDWKNVAIGYDALVYDLNAMGEYLPLIFVRDNGVNYPQHPSFGLDSYVGTFSHQSGEAINVLPSIVGATLAGIDKSDQDGHNWVLYSQDYFNKANGELIYLNNRNGSSGNDWWYDLMPNVFFYQLFDLYGGIGDAEHQFISVADRFAESVRGLGGSETPWTRANMHYRAWNFRTMMPNATGVPEPEAAGAYAWVLYHAHRRTGNPEYLKAAEWSMEFLSNLGTNPSYELQLPYGCYTAARMNAELGTKYAIDKMLFWVFNRGPLRGWGTVVDTWGGLDVSGLVGEANENGNDYVFLLNGIQQAAALIPMVRYDKRYARAIAKWVLNLSNATRLMYSAFLPSTMQDGHAWSQSHDPASVIGYEALRETLHGFSPFATGDAVVHGWGETNFALYGSSSIGYLGAMISKTEVNAILLIDLLKTDFFAEPAYPTYLLFNPYAEEKSVMIHAGDQPVDIYDALTEAFILTDVQGDVTIEIPADQARLLVYVPAGAMPSYDKNRLLMDDIVIDYGQTAMAYDVHPRIQSLAVVDTVVAFGDTILLYGQAYDPETKDLEYHWSADAGIILDSAKTVRWVAPEEEVGVTVMLIVTDESMQTDTACIVLQVVEKINSLPQILSLVTSERFVKPGEAVTVTCEAIDPDGDPLFYSWTATDGIITGAGATVQWQSPGVEGIQTITVEVTDGQGGATTASTQVLVRDFEALPASELIAWYPFSGNADDHSGNALHGTVFQAKLTDDFDGNSSSAYAFDGINDHIAVQNAAVLNFEDGISVVCTFMPSSLPARESFILSHGSWHNRWKISITPEGYLRWTVKATNGTVIDLDSRQQLATETAYHLAATYDGKHLLLFINGLLESYTSMTGKINPSPVEFLMGQMLPGVTNYNFHGVLAEVMIYDMALTPGRISELAGVVSSVDDYVSNTSTDILMHIFPNPVSDVLFVQPVRMNMWNNRMMQLRLYDHAGRVIEIRHVFDDAQQSIDLDGLPAAIYYLCANNDDTWQCAQIIKH